MSQRLIELDGETLTLSEWSRRTGLNYSTINNRLSNGWSVKDALKKEVDPIFGIQRQGKITKNDAELWLNDQGYDALPDELRSLLSQESRKHSKRYGTTIRNLFRSNFDSWFINKYIKGVTSK